MTTSGKKAQLIRIIAAATVITVSMGIFSGCGKKVNDKDDKGRTVISVGVWPSKKGVNLDNANARKERFEKANPDVVIEPDTWTFDRKTFYAKAAGGNLPVLYQVAYTEMPEIISSGYSADISKVLKKRGYDGMFNESVMDVISKNGKVYGFPLDSYVLGLAYNTELFEKAGLMESDGTPKQPKDWYELAEFAQKIKKSTGKAGFVFPTANNNGGWMFTPIAWSFGVEFMKKDSKGKWQATFNTKECVDTLQYIKDLKWKYDVLPANTFVDYGEMYKSFATGNAAMLMSAGSYAGSVSKYGMTPEQSGIMALPAGPRRNVTLLGGSVWCIRDNATEDQIDAAVRWLETAISYKLTDEFKTNKKVEIEKNLSENKLVGVNSMSIWSEKAESRVWENELIAKNANANKNHFKLYNDFVANCPAEVQPEEPVCCQELYGILDSCIQEVLTNKDADCSKIIKNAASDFQKNYLDKVIY